MTKKRLQAYLILTMVALIWGVASPVIKYTLNFITPYSFLFWRFLFTSFIFLPFFVYFIRRYPVRLKDLPSLAFLGFLGTPLTILLIFEGYTQTSSMDGVLISATAPIFITLGGAIFLKEKVTRVERIGLIIALIGSLITILQPVFEGGLFKPASLRGNLLIFGSVISWMAFTLLSKHEFKKHHPFLIAALSFFVGLITVTPLFFYERWALIDGQKSIFLTPSPFFQIPPGALGGIIYMTVFSSFIAYPLYEYGLSRIEASEATLFAYLQPIFAAPVALFWLKEKITLPFLTGAVIIALGVFLAEIKRK